MRTKVGVGISLAVARLDLGASLRSVLSLFLC